MYFHKQIEKKTVQVGRYVENDAWLRVCRSSFIFKPININIIYDKRSNSLANNNTMTRRVRKRRGGERDEIQRQLNYE